MSADGNYSNHSIEDLFGGIVPLKNYVLRTPAIVILEDDRDPFVSWQNHLARTAGLRGGVDLVASVGTPVYARTAGRMLQLPNDGTAGNSSRYAHRDNPGWQDVFSHLSSYKTPKNPTGANAFDYEAGDIVAYTGNTGGVAPHLHWHLLDPSGVRRNPWNYFSGSSTAGGGTTPIDNEDEEIEMGTPNYYWAPDASNFKRGGVLITEHMGPISPPNAEYAQVWKEEYPAANGTDIDGRKWDILVQSARDRKAQWDAQIAAATPAGGITDAQIAALALKVAESIRIPAGSDPAVIAKAVAVELAARLTA
jgi:hypothetical protein